MFSSLSGQVERLYVQNGYLVSNGSKVGCSFTERKKHKKAEILWRFLADGCMFRCRPEVEIMKNVWMCFYLNLITVIHPSI